jgi:DNA-binding NarL/FixJ family response regulator
MGEGQKDQSIRIVIAGGYVIFRQGLRILLDREEDITIVGEAKASDEVPNLVRRSQPDVLLLDIEATDYRPLDVLRILKGSRDTEAVRTILLLPSVQRSEVVRALKLGACGILPKDALPEVLLKSIRAVMNGVLWVDREIVQTMIHAINEATAALPENRISDVTAREMDIIRAIVDGQVNKEIAETFGISEYTVKHHLTRIFDKLRVANRVELAIFALAHGLVNEEAPLVVPEAK